MLLVLRLLAVFDQELVVISVIETNIYNLCTLISAIMLVNKILLIAANRFQKKLRSK